MTFEETFEKIKAKTAKADASKVSGKLAIQVNLTGEGEGVFYIEVKDGKLNVEPYDYHDRDASMTISAADFLGFLDKRYDPVELYTKGRLKAEGDLGKALELKKLVK